MAISACAKTLCMARARKKLETAEEKAFYQALKDRIFAGEHGEVTKIAQMIGVHRNTVDDWKNKDARPHPFELYQLALARGESPARLVFGLTTQGEDELSFSFKALNEPQRQAALAFVRAFVDNKEMNSKGMQLPKTRPVSDRRRPVNRRDELPVFPCSRRHTKKSVQIGRWEAVAAGFGEDLIQSPQFTYVRELPDWRNVHSVLVRGDSMNDTLIDGDLILVRTFGEQGIELPPVGDDGKNSMARIQRFVPDDEIFILQVNDEPPTCKRIEYLSSNGNNWHLVIKPDNPAYKQRIVESTDHVVFWGRILGLLDGDKISYGIHTEH